MVSRHAKAPPRPPRASEDEALTRARLCIRVMERFLAAVSDNPKTEPAYLDLLDMYMDTLQDELAPFAFDLTYELFSEEVVVKKRRKQSAGTDGHTQRNHSAR